MRKAIWQTKHPSNALFTHLLKRRDKTMRYFVFFCLSHSCSCAPRASKHEINVTVMSLDPLSVYRYIRAVPVYRTVLKPHRYFSVYRYVPPALATIVFEKSPTLSFSTTFSARQLSPPECKLAEQNWYPWHTVDVLYIHTKFHVDDMRGFWDIEPVCFEHMLTLWPT